MNNILINLIVMTLFIIMSLPSGTPLLLELRSSSGAGKYQGLLFSASSSLSGVGVLAETAKISLSAASGAGFKICSCTFREQNDKMQYLICTSAACQIKPQPNLIVSQHSSTQTQSDDSRRMSSVQDVLVWSKTPTRPMCRGRLLSASGGVEAEQE